MRRLIRRFDEFLRRRLGVYEFSPTPHSLLRIQRSRVKRPMTLGGRRLAAGEEIIDLHLWNEHMPAIPPGGPDLAWGARVERMFLASLRDLAREIAANAAYREVRALRAVTVLLTPGPGSALPLAQRLGFEVRPHRNPLGRFGEFWENFYTWWLMWTFNKLSVRHRPMGSLRRMEMWITAEEFLGRFGAQRPAGSGRGSI